MTKKETKPQEQLRRLITYTKELADQHNLLEKRVYALNATIETLVSVIEDLVYASDNDIAYDQVPIERDGIPDPELEPEPDQHAVD